MPLGGMLTIGLIGAGSKLFGAGMAAHGANKASKLQQEAAKKAFDFAGTRYNEARDIAAPYRTTGETALYRLSDLLQRAQAPMMPRSLGNFQSSTPQVQSNQWRTMSQLAGPGMAAPQPPPGGTVQMRAPTGEIATIPREQVSGFMARGAKVVG